jgi:energy-coupling factor transport system ATP-binding protein
MTIIPQIVVNDLQYHYPDGTIALKGVSFNIYKGEIVGIMGKNGAGKSTLIKTFNGLLKPTFGTVFVENNNISDTFTSHLSKKVGIVFQNPELQLFANSVEDEIKFSLKNLNLSKEAIDEKISETLKIFDLEKYRSRSPFNLSGGEKKRLAIASIMCRDPEIIVFDEPTIGQDASGIKFIKQIIKENATSGKTVVIVTHDIEFTIDVIPRIILMADGLVVADGPTHKLLSHDIILEMTSLTSPQLVKFSKSLTELGENVPEDIFLVEQMVQYLSKFFKNESKMRKGGEP